MFVVYLVAGGTAGHINAALSLGELFNEKSWEVKYLTGTRYLDKKLFAPSVTQFLDSKPLRTKNPLILLKNISQNLISFFNMLKQYSKTKPKLIIGAGGYVCGPTLLAGWMLGIPVFIIEQNAIAGLTNRILQRISKKVFTHFNRTKGIKQDKVIVSGNPVRSMIKPTKLKDVSGKLKLLVFGGSLGALQINEAIHSIITSDTGIALDIIHQVGKDNINHELMAVGNVNYQQLEYIENMNEKYEWADVIVSRAGASTISELRIVGKPAVLIPYPAATDNHQYYNACELRDEKRFPVVILDQKMKGKRLAVEILKSLMNILGNYPNMGQTPKGEVKNASHVIFEEVNKYVRD